MFGLFVCATVSLSSSFGLSFWLTLSISYQIWLYFPISFLDLVYWAPCGTLILQLFFKVFVFLNSACTLYRLKCFTKI